MLGWWIIIAAQSPTELDASATTILAKWEVAPEGINWIVDLVEAGKAEQIKYGGYPNRYAVRATHALPVLADKLLSDTFPTTNDKMQPTWLKNVELHPDHIALCSPDQLLVIEAWDQS
ncbi:hypothetical protein VA599_06070 [Chromobacterium sp. TRC.1.1.SA]|uniref:Uncharacterized protein n=1 Tax=Chromobacterium indicum TaxID=3110228 RepID=A0ABV0CGZ5_9NEIS